MNPVAAIEREALDVREIETFTVERKASGSDAWEIVADNLPGTARSHKDAPPDHRIRYFYRVTARGGDLSGAGATHPAPAVRETPWRLRFLNPSKDLLYIEIRKYDPAPGAWFRIAHNHRPGTPIGWWPETEGGTPTPMHWCFVKGKPFHVNFNTDMVLVSLKSEIPYQGKIQRCKKVLRGPTTVCEVVHESRTASLTRIIYKDEYGKEQIRFHPVPEDHPFLKNQLCPQHRPSPAHDSGGPPPRSGGLSPGGSFE